MPVPTNESVPSTSGRDDEIAPDQSLPVALVDGGSRVLDEVTRLPFGQQVVIGGASGWVVGYVSMKAGRWVLWAAGGCLIVLQLAHTEGYLTVNWDKINEQLRKVDKAQDQHSRSWKQKLTRFAEMHIGLSSGFLAGVLLGLVSG